MWWLLKDRRHWGQAFLSARVSTLGSGLMQAQKRLAASAEPTGKSRWLVPQVLQSSAGVMPLKREVWLHFQPHNGLKRVTARPDTTTTDRMDAVLPDAVRVTSRQVWQPDAPQLDLPFRPVLNRQVQGGPSALACVRRSDFPSLHRR